ncbi:glycosyltransferase family 4 protein [Desulfohalovibrio reitneri]|uniref:glycosyltransferase family 4 protein n=1 Tax=Desulfohalovibrio reitneri TaxID=1307759 RepID=UPI0009DF5D43|nr:glycosyltransferase family 4 protein [Desulfohalovibrio reitneri]
MTTNATPDRAGDQPMRVVQNQRGFTTPPYSRVATPLAEAANGRWLRMLRVSPRLRGLADGLGFYAVSGDFDAVVTVGHQAANVYCMLRRTFGDRGALHVAKEFYLEKARPNGAAGWAKHALKRLLGLFYPGVFSSVDLLVVNASEEADLYADQLGIPRERVVFLPWPSNVDPVESPVPGKGYVLGVGRSHRDWETFFKAAAGLDARVEVVAGGEDSRGVEPPENVRLRVEIPRPEYMELLEGADCVVIPLKTMGRSTGQAAFLEALALGKPLVVTDAVGSRDYIQDGGNGLLVPPEDPEAMRRAVSRVLAEPKLRRELGEGALESVRTRFNRRVYSRAFHDAVLEAVRRRRAEGRGPVQAARPSGS